MCPNPILLLFQLRSQTDKYKSTSVQYFFDETMHIHKQWRLPSVDCHHTRWASTYIFKTCWDFSLGFNHKLILEVFDDCNQSEISAGLKNISGYSSCMTTVDSAAASIVCGCARFRLGKLSMRWLNNVDGYFPYFVTSIPHHDRKVYNIINLAVSFSLALVIWWWC